MTEKKNILVVSSSFYPELSPRSFRTTELVKELARQGHRVTLYTLKDAGIHNALAEEINITIKDLGKLRFRRINVSHPGKWISLLKRVVSRALLMLFEYPDIELLFKVSRALKNEKGYDLLISVAVPFPIHWGVARARAGNKELTKTWVADCGDPYMFCKTDSFKKLFYFKYVEKWFCRRADYLTVPTAGAVQAYYPEFHSKIRVIPQGFNFEETPVYAGEIKNGVPTFAYAGGFIPGIRDPGEFLEFLCNCQQPYKFIIYTNSAGLVGRYVPESGNRVELRAYIPRKALLAELGKMDFLVNFNNGTAVQTPSKLIDYAITKRPVLSIDTGKLDTTAINDFLRGDYRQQFVMPDLAGYDIRNIAKQFVALYID